MNDNKLLLGVFICITIMACVGILTSESDHEKRMELIEEKRELIQLNEQLDWQKKKIEIDSLLNATDSLIENK
jgi:hypothetical protein